MVPELLVRLDSAQSIFFSRELEHVKKRVLEVIYAQLQMHDLVPAALDPAPFGAKKITTTSFDRAGFAKLIAAYADDLPNVTVFGTQSSVEVAEYGDSFEYSFFEIAAAALAGRPLPAMLMMAARNILEELLDKVLAYGEPLKNITGFFNNPNVPTSSVATSGGLTTWAAKYPVDPDLIYDDIAGAIDGVITSTKGRERPNTIVLPDAQHRLLFRKRSNVTDSIVWEMVKKTYPDLVVVPSWRAAAANSDGNLSTDTMVIYTRDPNKLYYEEPLPFTTMPPQERNLAHVINCIASSGGVVWQYPLSAVYRTGM